MTEQTSFETRVRETAIEAASMYYSKYVSRDYLLLSEAFKESPYYIVRAEKDNYLHLTGVSTDLSAAEFFDKCLDGTLEEKDFRVSSGKKNSKADKGSVRRKIKSLPLISNMFSESCLVEENFKRNTVLCSFASSDDTCTLGFTAAKNVRPKTLLTGNQLNREKARPLKIVLSRKRGEDRFTDVDLGTDECLAEAFDVIKPLISDGLRNRISSIIESADTESTEGKE